MKKLSIASIVAVIAALLVVTGAFALFFNNGSFESGSWTPGWDGAGQREFLIFNGGYDGTGFPILSSGGADLSSIVGGSAVAPLSIGDPNTGGLLKYPAAGHYSARINSQDSWSGGSHGGNANTLYQTTTVDAGDVDSSDGKVHLRLMYAAVMVEPVPAHAIDETPMFFLEVRDVTANTVLLHKQSYVGEPGVPWQATSIAGGTSGVWKFLDWTSVDVIAGDGSGAASILGHTLSVKIVATGCSPTGHPGYVYVDEIGSSHVGVPSVTASGPATQVTGSTITYAYNYFNGTEASIDPTIEVLPPSGVTFTTADPACTVNGGGFACSFTNVSAGTGGSFNISGTITAPGGSIINHGDYSIVTAGYPTLTGPVVTTNVTAIPTPSAFGKTTPVDLATNVALSTPLVWETSVGATSYEYCIETDGNNTCNGSWTSTLALTTASPTLVTGTTYNWQVRAVNAGGNTEANGGTWWTFTTIPVSAPEVEVWDGATNLTDGTLTAVDFGSYLACNPAQKTFTVKNIGTADLTLTTPTLPAGFTLVSDFGSTTLAGGTQTTFQVKLTDSSQPGTFSGSLSFVNSDADENPFNFPISATITNPASANMQVFMGVGSSALDSFSVLPNASTRKSYTQNTGPVRITSNTCGIASMLVKYNTVSYSELMGFPADKLTTDYWFPYYNNVAMESQLRISNVGGVSTTITVTYGNGTPLDSYTLAAGEATRKYYAGINSGPLHVTSNSSNILTSIRVIYGGTSFFELMGFPANQLTADYWFSYYNNVAMESQLRVSNVGGAPTTITVTYGNGTPLDSYTLPTGEATRKTYAGINSGPLHVTSSSSNILTTVRIIYENQDFSEISGVPANQLTKAYTYPVYDNVAAASQLRVSNVGGVATTITVYGPNNTVVDTYPLAIGSATRKLYPLNDGPLKVVSSASNIITSQRLLYSTPTFNSLTEIPGFPANQLTTEYLFPYYNNLAMNSQLRIALPLYP